jgi:hypothetical protein
MLFRRAIFVCFLLVAGTFSLRAGAVFYARGFGDAPAFGTIDPATGAVTPIGGMALPANADNIRFGRGNLYVIPAESNSGLYLLNQSTAAVTFIGSSGQDE